MYLSSPDRQASWRMGTLSQGWPWGVVELIPPSNQNYCGVNPVLERHTKIDERSPVGQNTAERVDQRFGKGEKGIACFSLTLGNPPITDS